MANFNLTPIRLFCDKSTPNRFTDLVSGLAPQFYRGDDIEIDVALGQGGAIYTTFDNFTSITLQIFQSQTDVTAPQISAVVLKAAMTTGLTQAQWNNNTNTGSPAVSPILPTTYQHAAFRIPNAQTGLDLGGQPSVPFWLRITAQFVDPITSAVDEETFLDGPINVLDGPNTSLSALPAQGFKIVTVNGQQQIAVQDSNGNYRILQCLIIGGVPTTSWSDQTF